MALSMLGLRRVREDGTTFARAVPRRTELTENYFVRQEIAKSRSLTSDGDGTGRIEIAVPYDGHTYFPRRAVADVQRVPGRRSGPGDPRAMIGHLLLADHTKTTGLAGVMRHHNQVGTIPITVPVAEPGGRIDLTGDRQACVIGYDYRPDEPRLNPIELVVDVHDLDSAGGMDLVEAFNSVRIRAAQGHENPSLVLEKHRQRASFSSQLSLIFRVNIVVAVKPDYREIEPVVREMSVKWPTLTSMRSTKLVIENIGQHTPDKPFQPGSVRYNSVAGRLEWRDIPVREIRDDGETRSFGSAITLLEIGHPGELFNDPMLEVNAVVEIPDYLLSGMESRLYDATGHGHAAQPVLMTKLHIRALVYPEDIFAGRAFSPFHQFVFDDIVPDEMRIADLITVLRNARFDVEEAGQAQPDAPVPTWFLEATRTQGADRLRLLIAVEGKRMTLGREQILDPNTKISGRKDSGQLKISVLGLLRRDHQELTRVLNAVQQELRDRFRFHQTSGGDR